MLIKTLQKALLLGIAAVFLFSSAGEFDTHAAGRKRAKRFSKSKSVNRTKVKVRKRGRRQVVRSRNVVRNRGRRVSRIRSRSVNINRRNGRNISRNRIRCLNSSCTVFTNTPSLSGNRSIFNDALLQGRGLSSLSHYGHGYSSRDLRLLALLQNAQLRALAGSDAYQVGNPYPNLGLYSALSQGEIGFLNPINYASQNYTYKPQVLETPRVTTGQPTPAGDVTRTLPASHSGFSNTAGGRPQAALTNGVTPVRPVSAEQRSEAETFPSDSIDWHYSSLGNAVKSMSNGLSAKGRFNKELCKRAYSQSAQLATDNASNGGRNLFAQHYGGGLGGGTGEITAITFANSLQDGINRCISQWMGSPPHKVHFEHGYTDYCYAVVPVAVPNGKIYACTGVFGGAGPGTF